jgi:PAS domain S-box-containing protein
MRNNAYHFDDQAMSRIFPFYFVLNKQMKMERFGDSLKKIDPFINEETGFADCFDIIRPSCDFSNFELASDGINQMFVLQNRRTKITLQGQWERVGSEDLLMFIGAPWFNSTEELNESGLLLTDFAPHNPLPSFLHQLKLQEIVNDDLRFALEKINNQKLELFNATTKLESLTDSLEESNLRYEYMSKATSEAIWDWDIVSGRVFQGIGFNKLFKYDITLNYIDVNDWKNRIHPNDFDEVMNSINTVLQSKEENWRCEYRVKKADGDYAMVNDSGYVIRDENAKPIRMVGAVLDITKQKEEEINRLLFQSVVTNTHDAILITEAKQGDPIVYVNEAFSALTGYTLNEVRGKNPKFLQGPESNTDAILQIRNSLSSGEATEVQTINYKKNGKKYWVSISLIPIRNKTQNITHWVAIERDVTQIHLMNEDMNTQKKFMEDILGNIPTDIAVFDNKHKYIFLNKYAVADPEIRRWLIGKDDFDYCAFKGIDNALAENRRNLFLKTIKNKTNSQFVDEHIDKKGEKHYVLRNLFPHFENNKLQFVIGYGIDITERKLIEIQLSDALQSIKKTNTELEQFAYVASHDLQEPLRMVTSFLTQLEKKYSDKLDERAKEYIHFAVDGAKRMRQIILDLLEFSRVGRQYELQKEIDVNEIIQEIELLHHQQIIEKHATINIKNLPIIFAHRTPLRQVFQNIIGNSLKYNNEGVAPEINIEAIPLKDRWQFKISDNGIGIEPEYYDKIFEIFQRLHNKDEYSGTGIGLAITKKIIENWGGKIWVTSILGKGTNFYFTIPFHKKKD